MKMNEMGGACGTYGGVHTKCRCGKLKEGDLGLGGRIILKLILLK
jgi:hypothetical protein